MQKNIYIYLYLHINIYVYYIYSMLSFQMENGKWKHRQFSLILLPLAHHACGSLSFVRCIRRNKRKSSVCKRTMYIEVAHLCIWISVKVEIWKFYYLHMYLQSYSMYFNFMRIPFGSSTSIRQTLLNIHSWEY